MKNNKNSPLKVRPLHVAGQSLDEQIQNYIVDYLTIFFMSALLIVVTIIAWLTRAFPSQYFPIVISIITLIVIIYCTYRIINLVKKINFYKLGRNGERIVAEIFDNLRGQGYVVFHDLVAENEKFNIDHVILSPHGIFTVETKTFRKPRKGEITFKDEKIIAGNINDYFTGRISIKMAEINIKRQYRKKLLCNACYCISGLVCSTNARIFKETNMDIKPEGTIFFY